MRIYVAGPMRGRPELNRAAFGRAARMLRELGHDVVNPHDLDKTYDGPDSPRAEDYRQRVILRDIREILTSDAVYFLDGHQASIGARAEEAVARWAEIPRYYEGEEELLEREFSSSTA